MTRVLSDSAIGIIGLDYVGLPLAVEFGKQYRTIGFDIKQSRIDELNAGRDRTREVDAGELKQARHLIFTADSECLRACTVFIITVGHRQFADMVDESGEDYLYPKEHFRFVALPQSVKKAVLTAV